MAFPLASTATTAHPITAVHLFRWTPYAGLRQLTFLRCFALLIGEVSPQMTQFIAALAYLVLCWRGFIAFLPGSPPFTDFPSASAVSRFFRLAWVLLPISNVCHSSAARRNTSETMSESFLHSLAMYNMFSSLCLKSNHSIPATSALMTTNVCPFVLYPFSPWI